MSNTILLYKIPNLQMQKASCWMEYSYCAPGIIFIFEWNCNC